MQRATSSIVDIAANVRFVLAEITAAARACDREPSAVTLVAVAKTFPAALVAQAHSAGIRHFGENYVQEAAEKLAALQALAPRPTWHMVGHVQTNKAKTVAELFDVVESLDSLRLAEALARHAGDKRLQVMLEVNVAGETSKEGFGPEAVPDAVAHIRRLPELEVVGLMTVAPAVADPEQVLPVFRRLRELRDELGLRELSMGMTDDFRVAIQEGATMVRLGRAVFGPRGH